MATDLDGETTIAFVKELTKSVAELNKEMAKTGEHAGVGIRKGSDETERFGKTVERHTQHVAGMNLQMGQLGLLVRGFGGAATIAAGAFSAMQAHVTEGLNLRNLATDLGISASAIGKLRSQLAAAGVDSKTADQQISALMAKLDDIKTLETASPVYKEIAANDAAFAKALVDTEKYGTRLQSIQLIIDQLNKPGERSKLFLGKTFGLRPSTTAALSKDWGDKLIQPRVYSEKELEEFNVFVWNVGTLASNTWGGFMQEMVEETNQVIKNTKREIEGLKNFANSVWGKGAPLSDENIMDFWDTITGEKALREKKGKEGKTSSFGERFGDWGDEDEGALPKNARPRSFSRESVINEELDVQKDSNRVLQDIRDALDETRKGGAGGGVGDTGSTGSTGASSPGSGNVAATPPMGNVGNQIATGSGADTQTGRGETPSRFANVKFNNPGAQYPSPQAAQFGMTGVGTIGGGHKIADFPTPVHGAASNMALLMSKYTGMTVRGAISKWSGGGRAAVPGYSGSTVITPEMARDPAFSIPFMKAVAAGEAPGKYPMSDEQWTQAHRWAMLGGAPKDEEARKRMDKSLVASRDLGGAKIKVDFTGSEKNGKTDTSVLDEGPFKKLKLSRAPQAPSTGGGVDAFNRFAFE